VVIDSPYDYTLCVHSDIDTPCRFPFGPKRRSACREERIDDPDQLQGPECDPTRRYARCGKRHVLCRRQRRVFSRRCDRAGQPAAGSSAAARGFIGIAFRLQSDGSYEYIYLRPTNGRADDQVRRNHSTQYSSYPTFGFGESRKEAPEKYESYVDLQPGVWTKYKIEVTGRSAKLYVNGAEQPCLIVNDMKLDAKDGGVALWIGPGTEGYFSNLKITAK